MESHPEKNEVDKSMASPGLTAQTHAVIPANDESINEDGLSITSATGSSSNQQVEQNTTTKVHREAQLNDDQRSEAFSQRRPDLGNPFVAEDAPPPVYSQEYGQINLTQNGLHTAAKLGDDGRVNISIKEDAKLVSNVLIPALRNQLKFHREEKLSQHSPAYTPLSIKETPGQASPPPPLNIVIHVVGSRGDVQPFVALGKVLKDTYGHRIRLATHPTFREFITENGLEFFSIGGDPSELMAFMVKNPGLMPGKDALRSGDIGKRRKSMYEIVQGCWRSCFEAGDGTGIAVSDDQPLENFNSSNRPFVADAIIANPPSFAHMHCAEKLGIPLHLMFTMPWSPTQSFAHPLANIQESSTDVSMTNFLSYVLVELMTWQGLGDVINRFREKSLALEPLSLMWAPGLATRLRIPFTYCWSPALIPKPKDWGLHINIAGFYFLSLAKDYQPPSDLLDFLNGGPPPIYIGFGSIVVDDPDSVTRLIFEAVKKTGQRALISKGWGGFGADTIALPKDIFMLGNVPHDWLFQHVSCVVHHGGAGTTAAGIALGKPTVIVPFFGDQPFWGAMIAKAGAGPDPIPSKHLDSEKLADAILKALKPATLERAKELGARIASEKGSDAGAKAFHDSLETAKMRCALAPHRTAVWEVKGKALRLSAFAAATLGNAGLLDFNDLKLCRYKEYDTEETPWEPIGGAASALAGTIGNLLMGGTDIPVEVFKIFSNSSQKASTKRAGAGSSKSDKIYSPPPTKNRDSTSKEVRSEQERIPQATSDTDTSERPPYDGHPVPRQQLNTSHQKEASKPDGPITMSAAIDAGRGVGRIVDAGLKSPMDFTLALAKGFHNAPRLYGDETVRKVDKVTDFESGLRAAGKGFGYGLYDGISGLVTQPLEGAKKGGLPGFLKGFGKGIGGVVLKPSAAAWSVPGYTFQGIYKEIRKRFGSSVQNYIIAARTAQGLEEWSNASIVQQDDVISRWTELQARGESKNHQWSTNDTNSVIGSNVPMFPANEPIGMSSESVESVDEYERAIQESVKATSTGNADEDSMIERAIRISLAEMQNQGPKESEEDTLARALEASVLDANMNNAQTSVHGNEEERVYSRNSKI